MLMTRAFVTATVNARDAVWLAESVTVAVKFAVPRVGDAPATRPPAEKLRPIPARLVVPAESVDQILPVPVPPVAVNCCEYATLSVPVFSGLAVEIARVA